AVGGLPGDEQIVGARLELPGLDVRRAGVLLGGGLDLDAAGPVALAVGRCDGLVRRGVAARREGEADEQEANEADGSDVAMDDHALLLWHEWMPRPAHRRGEAIRHPDFGQARI